LEPFFTINPLPFSKIFISFYNMFFLLKRLFSLFLPTFFAFLTNDFSLFLYANTSFILLL